MWQVWMCHSSHSYHPVCHFFISDVLGCCHKLPQSFHCQHPEVIGLVTDARGSIRLVTDFSVCHRIVAYASSTASSQMAKDTIISSRKYASRYRLRGVLPSNKCCSRLSSSSLKYMVAHLLLKCIWRHQTSARKRHHLFTEVVGTFAPYHRHYLQVPSSYHSLTVAATCRYQNLQVSSRQRLHWLLDFEFYIGRTENAMFFFLFSSDATRCRTVQIGPP